MIQYEPVKVAGDAYFFIDVTWKKTGKEKAFKHTVPCRGYNLKSQLTFNESLFWVDKSEYYEVSRETWEKKTLGSLEEENDRPRTRKNPTQQKTASKRNSGETKNKDSKVPRNPSGKSTRAVKPQPSELRESKVRNVRKPKKDIQGTNDTGTETLSKHRRTKRSSQ